MSTHRPAYPRRGRGITLFAIVFTVWGLQPWEPRAQGLPPYEPPPPTAPTVVARPTGWMPVPRAAYRPSADCEVDVDDLP